MNIGTDVIQNESSVKLLGIIIDNKLNFNEHVRKMCKKASKKLHALSRIANHMTSDKLKLVMRAFIESEFGCCPLLWMFHNRTLNICTKEPCVLSTKIITLQLLSKYNTLNIHQRNLQKLAIEMYKIKNNLSPLTVSDLFTRHTDTYVLRQNRDMGNFKCTHSNIRNGNGIFSRPENLGNCPRHD